MRIGFQTAALAVLVVVAIVYFTVPGRAQTSDSCGSWTAGMEEDEGGPVLTAAVCSDDATQTVLTVKCGGGTLWVEHDLAMGGEREPQLDEVTDVEFVTDGGTETLSMTYQAMNGYFGGEAESDGPLVELLKANASVLVRDKAAAYPPHSYSLKGSSAALTKLVSECR